MPLPAVATVLEGEEPEERYGRGGLARDVHAEDAALLLRPVVARFRVVHLGLVHRERGHGVV